jgi:hypothetical protein
MTAHYGLSAPHQVAAIAFRRDLRDGGSCPDGTKSDHRRPIARSGRKTPTLGATRFL